MLIEIIQIAITGFIFCEVLIGNGMLFDFYGRFIKKHLEVDEKNPKHPKLYKMFGGCSMCFTGQFAMWYYLFIHVLELKLLIPIYTIIFFVSIAIYITDLINKIDERI